MKNTTFRKKALLSSVAMLLVALVALGSATFAWFTNATTAHANGISVTANAAKGLQISTNGTNWGTNQTWAAPTNDTISPLSIPYSVSSDFPETGFYASKAGTDGAYAADNGYEYQFASKAIANPANYVNYDPYYLSYKVDAKLTGLADDDNTTKALSANIKLNTTSELGDAIRIAIVGSNGTCYGVYGDNNVKAITSTTPDINTSDSVVTTGTISCGTVSKTPSTLYVYVWIEGQDEGCVDDLMNLSGDYKITFTIPEF